VSCLPQPALVVVVLLAITTTYKKYTKKNLSQFMKQKSKMLNTCRKS